MRRVKRADCMRHMHTRTRWTSSMGKQAAKACWHGKVGRQHGHGGSVDGLAGSTGGEPLPSSHCYAPTRISLRQRANRMAWWQWLRVVFQTSSKLLLTTRLHTRDDVVDWLVFCCLQYPAEWGLDRLSLVVATFQPW